MELENELFLATIEWTWECCLKQKESDNEKSVTLCKTYKGGKFGLLQAVNHSGEIEYWKIIPYRFDDIIYMGNGVFCLFQNHQHLIKRLFLSKNYDVRVEHVDQWAFSGLIWMDQSGIVIEQRYDNDKSVYNSRTGHSLGFFKQVEITHGYALANDWHQYVLIDLTTDKTVRANRDYPYHYLCDYQDGSIFLAAPDSDEPSISHPMELVFYHHDNHSTTAFELTVRPDIVATLQEEKFVAKEMSLYWDEKPFILRREDGSAITQEEVLKAKSISNLLRRTADFCGNNL
jgi:hypothetical protein